MIDATREGRLIGTVLAMGEGGDVFERDGVFFCVGTTIVITPDDQEIVEATRSDDYASLQVLVESLPSGARFVPADASEPGV